MALTPEKQRLQRAERNLALAAGEVAQVAATSGTLAAKRQAYLSAFAQLKRAARKFVIAEMDVEASKSGKGAA